MSYYRVKQITRKNLRKNDAKYFYVYEEETFRDKRKYPKQRFKKIIGPYIQVKRISTDWYPLSKVRELPLKDCILDICRFNLINHGFKEKSTNLLVKDDITVGLNKRIHSVNRIFTITDKF